MWNRFGTLICSELQKLEVYQYDDPCYLVVEEIAKKLEAMISEREDKKI